MLPYEGEFETEDELIAILNKINQKVNTYPYPGNEYAAAGTSSKRKEYLQPLPSDDVIESYLPHDHETTVRSNSLVTYHNYKYSVPPEYIGKPVNYWFPTIPCVSILTLDLIAVHALRTKRMNYQKDHYQQLLAQTMKRNMVAELAEVNLKQIGCLPVRRKTMATYAKLLNGLTDLGIHKMQEHLDYIDLVNKGKNRSVMPWRN